MCEKYCWIDLYFLIFLGPTYFSTSAVQWGGGKLTGEKAISRMLEAAQEAKIESIDAGDVDIEGLTE